jgi:hypothetical protein
MLWRLLNIVCDMPVLKYDARSESCCCAVIAIPDGGRALNTSRVTQL